MRSAKWPKSSGRQRLRRRADGRVLVELRKAWRDGTTHLLFEPAEFLEKLPALRRPAANDRHAGGPGRGGQG